MRWPLRTQILIPMIFLIALALIGTTVVNAWVAGRREQTNIDRQMSSVVDTLNATGFPLYDNVLTDMSGLTGAEFVTSRDDKQIDSTSIGRSQDVQREIGSIKLVESDIRVSQASTAVIADREYFHLVARLKRQAREGDPPEWLHIFYPQATYRTAWQDAAIPPIWIGAITMIFAVIASVSIASHITRPINEFRNRVHQLSGGRFERIPEPKRNDEFRDLASSVNLLAKKLADYESEVRSNERLRTLGQLGAAMAHQLRNSVTGCKLAIDVHLKDCELPSNDSLSVARQQLDVMNEYLTRFLGMGKLHRQPNSYFELSDVINEVVSLARPFSDHSGTQIKVAIPDTNTEYFGDRHGLTQLMINLVLNAIEASHRASQTPIKEDSSGNSATAPMPVEIKLTSGASTNANSNREWKVEVIDKGQGPSKEVEGQLFEPMVTDKPEGTGLGLSVAKEIAERHGGEIRWQRVEHETQFTVHLPIEVHQEEQESPINATRSD